MRGYSHRPVIFPFSKRRIQIAKPTEAHWALRKSRLVPEEPSHQLLKHRNNTQQGSLTVSCMYSHRQLSHILINMWSRTFSSPPPTCKLCQHTVPNNCARVGIELHLCFAVGWTWQQDAEENIGQFCPSYLGSSLSTTPLCIWNVLVLSRFFLFPPIEYGNPDLAA